MDCSQIFFPGSEVVASELLRGVGSIREVAWAGRAGPMQECVGMNGSSEARNRLSSMQLNSLDRICNSHQGISAAERNNAAEAFKALCGLAAGFTGNGVKQSTFKEGLVVSPDPGTKMADGSTGSNLDVWSDWRMILLRSPSEFHEAIALEGRNAPHTDLELKRKPWFYARLVREMSVCGLVSFGPLAETFVRVFVVPKQHTSCVNQHFRWHGALPAPSSWVGPALSVSHGHRNVRVLSLSRACRRVSMCQSTCVACPNSVAANAGFRDGLLLALYF